MSPVALRLILRPGLRQPLLSSGARSFRHTPSWTQTSRRFSSQFFTRTAAPSPSISYKLLWVIPAAGGFALWATPVRKEHHNVFASPDLIPCSETAAESSDALIMSPSESDKTLLGRIMDFLRDKILEPVLTAQRFVYLCFLFVPVLLTAPMLLIGPPESKLGGDRWGAVWWYGFLTRQMQCAGPTFIKVSALSQLDL